MKKRVLFTFLSVVIFITGCGIYGVLDRLIIKDKRIKLIPIPQSIEIKSGDFQLSKNTRLVSDTKNNDDRRFTVELLQNEIQGKIWNNLDKDGDNDIVIGIFSEDKVRNEFHQAELNLIVKQIGEEGYYLKVRKKRILLAANTETGAFYGVQTLRQLIRSNSKSGSIPILTITDWPQMKYRGWQDDISRGPIPTMDCLKEQIVRMSEFKQNMFTLYTEHVFRLKNHPDIAPLDGITAEEVKELVEFGKKYHLEVIGNFQSFGHFAKILQTPGYEHLGETKNGWVLSPAYEESYKFLDDVYKEIAPVYESNLFNINCDETWGLGEGASYSMVDSLGLDGVYAYHINRVNDLLKKHDKRIMMWGDIAVGNPGIIEKLPKDLIVLSWGYSPEENFDGAILPFTKLGFDFMVCPGVGCWSKIWPTHKSAVINISNYIRDGYKHGAMGVLNTTWDDDGENLYTSNWYPLAWSAECSWNPVKIGNDNADEIRNLRLQQFDKNFNSVFFDSDENDVTSLLNELSELGNFNASRNMGNGNFWRNISNIAYVEHSIEAKENAQKLLQKSEQLIHNFQTIKKDVNKNNEIIDYAIFAAKRVKFIAEKELLGMDISESLFKPNSNLAHFKEELEDLANEVLILKREYSTLWTQENRNWWLDTNLENYDRFAYELKYSYLKTSIIPIKTDEAGRLQIEIQKIFENGKIYYTIDGSDPDTTSIEYVGPFIINGKNTIKAVGCLDNKTGTITEKTFYSHVGVGKKITLNEKYSLKYPGGGENGLLNGELGSSAHNDGKWQGYEESNVDVIVDLGKLNDVENINVNFLHNIDFWIFPPRNVEILVSENGKDFTLLDKFSNEVNERSKRHNINKYSVEPKGKIRYVKVFGENIGICPEWHNGAGGKAWIFIDEIVVELKES